MKYSYDSDKTLDRSIAYNERMLRTMEDRGQEGSWTAEKIRQNLVRLRQQRALPRNQRTPYHKGPSLEG